MPRARRWWTLVAGSRPQRSQMPPERCCTRCLTQGVTGLLATVAGLPQLSVGPAQPQAGALADPLDPSRPVEVRLPLGFVLEGEALVAGDAVAVDLAPVH